MVHAPLIMFNLQQLGLKSKRAKSNRAGRDLMWPFVSKCNYRCSISNITWLHFLSLCWGNRNEHRYLATKKSIIVLFSQFSHSVVSNSLQPHGLQHARLPCLSPTPRTHSNSCPDLTYRCVMTTTYNRQTTEVICPFPRVSKLWLPKLKPEEEF